MDNTKSRNQIDMLHGPLLMKIIVFTLPLAASSILQQLFNSVDVAVVGRFASSQALAAVGSNTPVISLLINLFMGVSMGANVIISNHIGQNDKRSIRDAIGTVGITALVSGLFLMVLGISVARPILTLMNTPADVLDLAVTYLRIFFLGIPFFMIFDFGSAILRSMGDTRRPLYILMVAGIVNTILNLIFVIVFHMSVAGVAIATSIANAVSAALIIYLLIHEKGPFRLNIKRMRVKWKELRRMLQIGVPAGLQGMVFSFSNVGGTVCYQWLWLWSNSRFSSCTQLRILQLFLHRCLQWSRNYIHRSELWCRQARPSEPHFLDLHGSGGINLRLM